MLTYILNEHGKSDMHIVLLFLNSEVEKSKNRAGDL